MRLEKLEDIYVEALRDLWSAEAQILKAMPRMIRAARDADLKSAFTLHERQSKDHEERLERIFKDLGKSPKGRTCVGMAGLLKGCAELIEEKPHPTVLDAGLISAAQHVEHYEMAGYGTCRTWARLLRHDDHAGLLQRTLDEEGDADKLLTALAVASVNLEAENGGKGRVARGALY